MDNKNLSKLLENFENDFNEVNKNADKRTKKLLLFSVYQIFRKWYYSAIDDELEISPAAIIRADMEEHKFKKNIKVPYVKVEYNKKSICSITLDMAPIDMDDHFVVSDIMNILKLYEDTGSVGMDVSDNEGVGRILNVLHIKDAHYLDFIMSTVTELGFIRKNTKDKGLSKATFLNIEEFIKLNMADRFKKVVDAAVVNASKNLSTVMPDDINFFTKDKIIQLLTNPADTYEIVKEALYTIGIETEKLSHKVITNTNFDIMSVSQSERTAIAAWYTISLMLDMQFFTVFGYYLQLIQPLYSSAYDLQIESELILCAERDLNDINMALFSFCGSYDITSLGRQIFGCNKTVMHVKVKNDVCHTDVNCVENILYLNFNDNSKKSSQK